MNPTLKAQFEAKDPSQILRDLKSILDESQWDENWPTGTDYMLAMMARAYHLRQSEIDALQAKITQFAGIILDYETKFDVIAENEGERMVEFGERVQQSAAAKVGAPNLIKNRKAINDINIKQLYTNFKRKDNGK